MATRLPRLAFVSVDGLVDGEAGQEVVGTPLAHQTGLTIIILVLNLTFAYLDVHSHFIFFNNNTTSNQLPLID